MRAKNDRPTRRGRDAGTDQPGRGREIFVARQYRDHSVRGSLASALRWGAGGGDDFDRPEGRPRSDGACAV